MCRVLIVISIAVLFCSAIVLADQQRTSSTPPVPIAVTTPDSPCIIGIIEGPTLEASQGESVSLNCIVTEIQNPANVHQFRWSKIGPDGSAIAMPNNAEELSQFNVVSTLKFARANPNHSGQYRCEAFDRNGVNFCEDDSIDLIVHSSVCKQIDINPRGPVIHRKVGESLSLTCNCIDLTAKVGQIRWFKQFENSSNEIELQNAEGKFVIQVLRASDAGIYKCVLFHSLTAERLDEEFVLLKIAADKAALSCISIDCGTNLVHIGETAELRCKVGGNTPVAKYTWWKVGGSVGPNVQKSNEVLRVQIQSKADEAYYKCEAETLGGQTLTAVAYIDIQDD